MNNLDPIDELRSADRFPTEAPLPTPARSATDLFDAIVKAAPLATSETEIATTPTDMPAAVPIHRRRGRVMLPAAAAAAGLFTAGALVLGSGSSPAALAMVTDAAQSAAAYDSGHVTVKVDIEEAPGEDGPGMLLIDYRYDADDFSFEIDITGLSSETDDGSDPLANDDLSFSVLAIGDSVYSSFGGSESYTEEERTFDATQRMVSGGFDTGNVDPASVIELLSITDEFERSEENGDMVVYRGTLTLETLQQLDEDAVPAGLDMLVGGAADDDDLPESVDVEVVVTDDVLTSLTIDMDGPTPTGPLDATIVTTFADLGEPQSIIPPPSDSIVDAGDVGLNVMPEGFEEDLALLEEAMNRRPELCNDVFVAEQDASGEEILAEIDDFIDCLDEAGETEAADAFRRLNSMSGVPTAD